MANEVRDNVSVTANQNINFNAQGAAVLVQLSSSDFSGLVDFQTTVDGSTFYNIPYIDRTLPGAVAVTDQLEVFVEDKLYLLLGPLSQVRIAVTEYGAGTLPVVWRTIVGTDVDHHRPLYDYILRTGEIKPRRVLQGATLLDQKGISWKYINRRWVQDNDPVVTAILRVETNQADILAELKEIVRLLSFGEPCEDDS